MAEVDPYYVVERHHNGSVVYELLYLGNMFFRMPLKCKKAAYELRDTLNQKVRDMMYTQTMVYVGSDERLKGKEAHMKSSPHLLPGWALFQFPGELKFRPMLVSDFQELIGEGQPTL